MNRSLSLPAHNPLIVISMIAVIAALTSCIFDDDDKPAISDIWGAADEGLVNGTQAISRFNNPANVEVAADGTVYVADYDNDAVRAIAPDGSVRTLVDPSVLLPATFSRPFGLALAPDGFLYVQTDGNDMGARDITTGTIWRVDTGTGLATVVARNLGRPRGLQALSNTTLAMSDIAHHVITVLNLSTGVEAVLAGTEDMAGFANATGAAARFDRPYGLALLPDGSLLVADQNNHRLRQITLPGAVVTTFAGSGMVGSGNGPVATATFNFPQDVAVAGANVYVSDHDNFLVRRIKAGTVSTEAGSVKGFAVGVGNAAAFYGLEGLAVTTAGTTLWIADGNNGEDGPDGISETADDPDFNRVRRLAIVP